MKNIAPHDWIQSIRRYVFEMIFLLFILATIALVYSLWFQAASSKLRHVANDFHLASSFYYSQAMQELRAIGMSPEYAATTQPGKTDAKKQAKTKWTAATKMPLYSTSYHLVRRDIEAGLDLQQRFNDSQLQNLVSKLRSQLSAYALHSSKFIEHSAPFSPVVGDIHILLTTLDQLVRLHKVSHDELLVQSGKQEEKNTTVFYGLLFILFAVGIFKTSRGLYAINTLISERERAAKKIHHQAHYDSLTDLPNRLLSLELLSQLIDKAKRNKTKVALLFLDLDDFKKVNDTLGHGIGDKLLVLAAQRLKHAVRKVDTVGRLGGDEFVVILGNQANTEKVNALAEHLVSQMSKPFKIDDREMRLTTSLGIGVYPQDGSNPHDLLRSADSAMYHAKSLGRNTHAHFTKSINAKAQRRVELEEQMLGALDRGEFSVLYQPKVDLRSGEIMGAEALLRWHNPTLGQVTPDEFIPVAENTGQIVPIGQYVLNQALQFSRACMDEKKLYLHMAVNLSPRQFSDSSLVSSIKSALLLHGIHGNRLELEITEGVLLGGDKHVENTLAQLKSIGVKLAMDDFGTGYSSLSYLRNYPFDVVKIDRSFINDLGVDEDALNLIKAAISMAKSLRLEVVAEGVETEEQLALLTELSCEFAQGYLLGKPMPEADFINLIESTFKQDKRLRSLGG